MVTAAEIESTARAGADSVFRYIERTAEVVPDGIRWQTLNWDNQPQYDMSVYYGVAGIVFFLADYYRLTGTARALELAIGAARWCSQPERLTEGSMEEWRQDGLVRGRAGAGMAWLWLAEATGDRQWLAEAAAIGADLARKEPNPVTDWLDGAAGEGLFLLRLAQASGERPFLEGAIRNAELLVSGAIRNEHGLYWPWQIGDEEHGAWYGLSFLPGSAGIAHFLLEMYRETRDRRWADVAREAMNTLRRQARPDHGGLNWPDTLNGLERGETLRCQWCNGAPGVGIAFITAHETLGSEAGGESGYLAIAEAAGETTYQYGDVRQNAVQCHGLAGNAELFLDLYHVTRKPLWLERAHDFATRMFAYRSQTPEGDSWQADDAGYFSPDYMLGAAGTGHFFLRLWQPDTIKRPML